MIQSRIGTNFLGVGHTMQHYKCANFDATLCDATPFEQWSEAGSRDMQRRAFERWRQMLADYEAPPIDADVDAELRDYVARRKASMPDQWY